MIFIGSDHGGFDLKESVKSHLEQRAIEYQDLGTFSHDSCDYAKIAEKVANAVVKSKTGLGLLFCGTGVGISIAANKVKGVRAACCSDYFSAKLTRQHNNANILCLGGRVVGYGLADELVDIFLDTNFSDEDRHQRRIDQITQIENE